MTTGVTRAGIPTMYAGTLFRSRLEATWAAFFDRIRWSWVYEPIDATGYIPDFLITGEHPIFVEIGPCATLSEYRDKATKADGAVRDLGRDLIVLGVGPLAPPETGSGHGTAGWLGEYLDEQYEWDSGLWGRCHDCQEIGVVHFSMSYVLRPCGHHQSGGFGGIVSPDWLTALWRGAANDTQWAARRPKPIGELLRGMR